ncbi:hypothetical protein CCR75_000403 [Bremia lactucae]|uniref:Protein kinase domain-containing protein n=1 Tax=Bremia lactucae TaxID=4779 RepID=A0A976FK25_BRELC|nr:hypothetical protein CCR75_000403 [Bremia lactucae]
MVIPLNRIEKAFFAVAEIGKEDGPDLMDSLFWQCSKTGVDQSPSQAQPLGGSAVSSPLAMNGSSVWRPHSFRARTKHNMLQLLTTLLLLYFLPLPVAATACVNASTLVEGESDLTAVVYDANCVARSFLVVGNSAVERSLNLSNLNVVEVRSYPRVYQLLLNNNEIEILAPTNLDNDMETLELASNVIMDLSDFRFPKRLTYLDLSYNSIATLSYSTPWPESGELQTLLLHGNSLSSVSVDSFSKLVALQSLSLSNTGISNLNDLILPVSLRKFNATRNSFTSASTNFSNLPTALQYFLANVFRDLSNNLLTVFPTIVSSLTTLVELNLESNGIKQIHGVTFASTLRKIYLNDNPLSTIEICRSDVSVFQSLTEFSAPLSVSSTCSNVKASREEIKGVSFCVLEDNDCIRSSVSNSAGGSTKDESSSSLDGTASSELRTRSKSWIFSAESIGIIGTTFLVIGILLSALVFGYAWKKRQRNDDDLSHRGATKLQRDRPYGSSGGNFLAFTSSGRVARAVGNNQYEYHDRDSKNGHNSSLEYSGTKAPGEDAAWSVYDSPLDNYTPVALLESSPKGSSFHGASTVSLQVRSKIKSKMNLDDLLVFEIPPEEIQMRQALHMSTSKSNSKTAFALSSMGVRSLRKVDTALFLAEYQGYKVVIQALMRSKKRFEQHFVEQIRLAAALDHASIVHFIGVTTGCSATASRQRGSSATAVPFDITSSYGLNASKSRYPTMGAPAWHLGVVFEYMQHGSLASMFKAERRRREGNGYYISNNVAVAIGSGTGNIFSWYPVFVKSSTCVNANPNTDWRCKLSIALDVAMGLVYLHANNYAHGCVCARKVLVNEQGEAKLSAMDVLLPSDLASFDNTHTTDDFHGSLRESARWTMQKLAGIRSMRVSKGPAKESSGELGRSRYANNSGESGVSGVSGATLDENHSPGGDQSTSDKESSKSDENSFESSNSNLACVAAQRDDVYAFGTFLWELDTMIAVEEDLMSLRVPSGNSQLLKFSQDCPLELQELARQCWHESPSERPDAIDVQEELVRVLEGRLTTSGQPPPNWTPPSYVSAASTLNSLSSFEPSSYMSSSRSVTIADLEGD